VTNSLTTLTQGTVGGQLTRVMNLARRHLDMDVVFVAEFADGRQVYHAVPGATELFTLPISTRRTLVDTYGAQTLRDSTPNAVPNARLEALLRDLPLNQEFASESAIGVPVMAADGTAYGSLCCLSHEPQKLEQRDSHLMRMLANLVGSELQELINRTKDRDHIYALLEHERIAIALQPIFDIHDGRCLGVEALSRFPAEYGTTLEIFESAYRVGLGLPLERLALGRAIGVVGLMQPDRYLSVNLTPEVVHALSWAVEQQTTLMPSLVLEITEHAAVQSYAQLRETLRLARELGLRLAIDDAGAGYASLKHVIELEPDIVKIDRSLIDGVAGDRARRSVVSAFVLLALDQGSTVVAEGVERQEDLDAIRDLGVDAAQGYLLARPTVDRTELHKWIDCGSAAADVRPARMIA
jgi:EAL domain-containing protein (putative c-di-GMP-specific phosphodiesterase class I)